MLLEVQSAAQLAEPRELIPSGITAAQRRGLKYQAKVEQELERLYGLARVSVRPWFRYKTREGVVRKCQPDVLVFSEARDHVLIVEIKYSTEPKAWYQLSTLYVPVVAKAYRIPTSVVLITRGFDPHVGFPCKISQLEGLDRVAGWRGEGLGVVSWR